VCDPVARAADLRPLRLHPGCGVFGDLRARQVIPGRAPSPQFLLFLVALCLAFPARAQVSGSLALTSDYRLFGVSLTDRRPALRLGVVYDHPSGFYVGGSLVGHDPEHGGARMLGHTEYAGFAGRRPDGLSWDVGVNNVDLSFYRDRRYPIEYNQIYVGIAKDALDAHVYFSPNYPERGGSTVYVDLNGALRPADNWRLTGHAGALVALADTRLQDDRRARYDVTVGVAREWTNAEISLGWTVVFPRPDPKASWTRSGIVAGLTYFF
jgi:uncharacterized protein (TIGR02001 family)